MSNRLDRPHLTDVTLVAATSVALGATVDALHASMLQANFGEVLLLSDQHPSEMDPAIKWRQINRLGSRADYSRFMLQELAEHISTTHALCIQWDGFVLKGSAWDPRFLEWDYIGAVWPHFHDGYKVGNGGFSLRSRRLLRACRDLSFNPHDGEDVIICRLNRPQLEERGILFAPEAVAGMFAYERTRPTGEEFGFHGAFNLVEHVPSDRVRGLLRSLEPGMLARNERWELLRWALVHGDLRIALTMLARLTESELPK